MGRDSESEHRDSSRLVRTTRHFCPSSINIVLVLYYFGQVGAGAAKWQPGALPMATTLYNSMIQCNSDELPSCTCTALVYTHSPLSTSLTAALLSRLGRSEIAEMPVVDKRPRILNSEEDEGMSQRQVTQVPENTDSGRNWNRPEVRDYPVNVTHFWLRSSRKSLAFTTNNNSGTVNNVRGNINMFNYGMNDAHFWTWKKASAAEQLFSTSTTINQLLL